MYVPRQVWIIIDILLFPPLSLVFNWYQEHLEILMTPESWYLCDYVQYAISFKYTSAMYIHIIYIYNFLFFGKTTDNNYSETGVSYLCSLLNSHPLLEQLNGVGSRKRTQSRLEMKRFFFQHNGSSSRNFSFLYLPLQNFLHYLVGRMLS